VLDHPGSHQHQVGHGSPVVAAADRYGAGGGNTYVAVGEHMVELKPRATRRVCRRA